MKHPVRRDCMSAERRRSWSEVSRAAGCSLSNALPPILLAGVRSLLAWVVIMDDEGVWSGSVQNPRGQEAS